MPFLEYGETELTYLSKKDRKLGVLIEKTGHIKCKTEPDLFDALVGSIATQQISSKAGGTVRRRLLEKFGVITAQSIAATSEEEIKTVGISMKKAVYICGLRDAVLKGELDIEKLRILPDEEVAARLLPIKGIGSWTIEMFLIFSLGRMDVVSFGDFAIRKGMKLLYGRKEILKEDFARYRKRYSPYGSVASLYLWALSEGNKAADLPG